MLGNVSEQSLSVSASPSQCLFCTNTAQASSSTRCCAMGPDVCVPLANFKLGAAASKLAGMFYSLLTMPDSADITVCTQWHLWSIPFLQVFPNTPPGMHKNRSHLRHRGSGMVCPLAQLAPCAATSRSASARRGRAGVCPHRRFYGWFRTPAVHLLSDLLLPHLRSYLSPQGAVCLFREGDYNIYFPAEMGSLINHDLSNCRFSFG